MSNFIDFGRLSYLGDRLKAGLATKQEKDEYMLILYKNGSITQKQYNEYLANGNKANTDEIVNAALAVGAVLLIGYLISEMFKSK
jgi:Ni,Fe-hydrogenase I small subunit